jgi:predicted solute-binding protein
MILKIILKKKAASNKQQAASSKLQASSFKLDKERIKDYIGWYVKERITENCRRPEQAKQDAWASV